jgi:hypothetical protein
MSSPEITREQQRTESCLEDTSVKFAAENVISSEIAAAMMGLAPTDPFCTRSYVEAMRASGLQPWLVGAKRGCKWISGFYGFIASGRLNRTLIIPSLPDVPFDDVFWESLIRFFRMHRVTYLQLTSRSGSRARIPPLPGKPERYEQYDEYVLDLGDSEWEQKLPRNHRRNIKSAMESGVTLRRTTSGDACREHVRLMAASQERRRKRGETIIGNLEWVGNFERAVTDYSLLVEKGPGELFQVVEGGKVLSSGLVLMAAEGACFHTSGHSPEGMKCGTAHFLWYSIIRLLREESMRTLNTGKTEPNSGLSRFKSGFGATPVPAEDATIYLGSDLRRNLTEAVRAFRQIGSALHLDRLHF